MDELSVRNLVDSDFEIPLRKFTGTFDSYATAPATGYQGTRIELNFKDLDNIVAISPYNFPTAIINVGRSNKNKSRWGYLANSIKDLIPAEEDIADQKGRRMTLVYTDGQDGRPSPDKYKSYRKDADPEKYPDKMVPSAVWIVTEIEGAKTSAGSGAETGVSTVDWALQNLIGKTRAQFNKWAFADPKIRGDQDLQRAITDKSFITGMLQLGKVTEDGDGVFQKV